MKRKDEKMKTEVLSVSGMSCAHCSARAEEAIRSLDGVENVAVDLEGAKATVAYDESKLNAGAIKKAVEDAGYGVGNGAAAVEETPKKKGFFRRG